MVKPVILILHPLFFSGSDIKKHALFAALEQKYRLVCPDFACHGSNAELPFSTMQTAIAHILKDLSSKEPNTSFVGTIGLSLGARVALELISNAPDRFGKLFLDGIPLINSRHDYDRTKKEMKIIRKLSRICPFIIRKLLALSYGKAIASSMVEGIRKFDETNLNNLILSCTTPLPTLNQSQIDRCLFCFGSKEPDFHRKSALFAVYPNAKLKIFERYDHIQYCAQNKNEYCQLILDFIAQTSYS